jgi:hypothetical protein
MDGTAYISMVASPFARERGRVRILFPQLATEGPTPELDSVLQTIGFALQERTSSIPSP